MSYYAGELKKSGISFAVTQERGYRVINTGIGDQREELELLGFSGSQIDRASGGLLVPIHTVNGGKKSAQFKPRNQGSGPKYISPSARPPVLDVPPRCKPSIGNPHVPLYITEGAKKADSAASRGLCCISIAGVWNWRGRNKDDGLTALGDWDNIALNDGRTVTVVFDSDAMRKPQVHSALVRIGRFLASRGAHVGYAYLPCTDTGAKVGLDDFLVAGGTVQELERYVYREPLREPASEDVGGENSGVDDEYLPVHDLTAVADEKFVLGWLVQGWWPHPAFGQLAGAEKTLKSYVSTLLALAVASGKDFLGTYPVRTSGPVLVYTGEGSRHLWWRRAEHLGLGMGLSPKEVQALPIRVVDEIAQIKTPVFKRTLDRELERNPVLVILDPLYAYHGSKANAGNLHEVADILTALSGPTQRAGASLVVVNHFTKAGAADLSLSSITWAGAREWSGAWCLLKHAKPPDLARQQFVLDIVVGSREGNGANRRLEIDLGPLDEHTMRHEGAPTWSVCDITTAEVVPVEDQITGYLWTFQDGDHRPTESDVLAFLKGKVKRAEAKSTINVLVIEGGLVKKPGPHREGDSTKKREVFYLGRNGVDLDGS
jgi:hypothetical protein